MIVSKREMIRVELEAGTGAAIAAVAHEYGLRSGLRIWFADLDQKHGPVAELRPYGLKGYRVDLFFGDFSGGVIDQIKIASPEDVQLARALIGSIRADIKVEIQGQTLHDWRVTNGAFRIAVKIRDQENPHTDAAVIAICREVIVPMMAAMAELIGYDVIAEPFDDDVPAFDGAILRSVVHRRERNPRNRLLCLRVHGEKCAACGLEPKLMYGPAGSIIEVHHLEPLALLAEPRPYDPRKDLVPLCPSCHSAVHTRRPVPIAIEELKTLIEANRG